jgi:DNA ligase (NAD+)
MIIKDHPFYDGNKRIASFLFIIFLTLNKSLTQISDRGLVALALLIAESNPREKDLMVALTERLLV